jgi:ubiquinone biosynthesis protein Coq4
MSNHGGTKVKTVHQPTRNPLRIVRAVWRTIRDLGNTEEALTVEMAFFRSRLLRRYARWEESARELRADARTATAFEHRPRIGRLDLDALARLPAGTLGQVFAAYVEERGLNPYLFEPMPDETDGDYVMAHLLETHDIWHIATGSETDVAGEFRLMSFYAAQTGLSSASMLLTLGFANTTLFAPDELRTRMQAICDGWELGKRSQPLFGTDWKSLWDVPLSEIRSRFSLKVDDDLSSGELPPGFLAGVRSQNTTHPREAIPG